ncbi:MAG: LPS export ABC transporter permease LptG [Thermodesulfobacteriota bacterium]
MKLLQRYILGEFLKLLTLTTLAFITIFMLVDVVEKVDDLIEHGVPFGTGARFFLYKIPFILCQVAPISVLLAVLLSLGILNRHGEIMAIKAGGVGIVRALSPLFAAGAVATVLVFFVSESIVPTTNRLVDSIEGKWLRGEEETGVFGESGLWLRSGGRIYNIREVDRERKTLHGITAYGIEKTGIRSRVFAREAAWQAEEGQWIAEEATLRSFPAGGRGAGAEEKAAKGFPLEGLKGPEELLGAETSHERMSLTELRRYVHGLEAEGYDARRYRVDLYGKLFFPLVNFIMVLVAVPFALRTGRHGGIAAGVALSVAIGFSYWVVFGISRALGQSGMLPAIVAASFPDVLFLAVGVLMFGYIRQ